MDTFDAVRAAGEPAIVLVAGYSGVGKSALVRELHRPVTEARGRFAAGKADQLSAAPHRALAQALDQLVVDALAAPDDRRRAIAAAAQTAAGPLGSLILDLVPRAQHLLGPQPPAPALPPAEARGRFEALIARFLRALSGERPLVLFLDDLQWSGATSLELLRRLALDRDTGPVLFVGAYRDNEVQDGDALPRVVDELEAGDASLKQLTLGPLSEDATDQLLRDALGDRATALTAPLHAATGGNPYFLQALLHRLADDGTLAFEAGVGWTWSAAVIAEVGITANVADLVVDRLRTLPEPLQRTLSVAALLGGTFDLTVLSTAEGRTRSDLARSLREAVTRGLIVPLSDAWRFDDFDGLGEELRYRFPHDRVQEAAIAGLAGDTLNALRLSAGRSLVAGLGADADPFLLVGLFNPALDAITDPAERLRVARLDLDAGRKALDGAASTLARRCLDAGRTLAGDAWAEEPELAFDLAHAAAVAAQQCGDDAAAQVIVTAALAHTEGTRSVRLLLLRQAWQARTGAHADGMATGLDILARLGHPTPADPAEWPALGESIAARVAAALDGSPPSVLADRPELNDPDIELAVEALSLCSPLIWTVPHTLPVINAWLVALFAEHGLNPRAAAAFASFALQNSAFGNHPEAEAWSRLAVAVAERRGEEAAWAPVGMMVGVWIRHWVAPLEESLDLTRRGVRAAVETGRALDWGSWSAMNVPTLLLAGGVDLGDALEESERMARIARARLNVADCHHIILGGVHTLCRLLDRSGRRAELDDGGKEFGALISSLDHYPMMQAVMQVGRMQASAVLGDWQDVLAAAEDGRASLDFGAGIIHRVQHRFYEALARLETGDVDIAEPLALLEGWAAQNPALHGSKVALLVAEQARVAGDPSAVDAFEQAIAAARRPHLRGLILERAGRFHRSHGLARYGRALLEDAWVAYARWGAEAKLRALAEEFAFLGGQSQTRTTSTVSLTTTGSFDGLDADTLTRATRAISTELDLDRLVQTVLDLMVENAGATGGVLLLAEGDDLREVARNGEGGIAWTAVRLVRSGLEPLVVGDASTHERFADDARVSGGVRSLLVQPIVRRDELQALVYLENTLVSDAFTEQRQAILDVLGAQAAISLANARLFDEQQRQSRAIARFVPREFLALLGREDVADIELGDTTRLEMTVLFSDIRSFTSMSERMEPEQMFAFLNRYLGRVGPVIRRHGGFIDKYIGDAVMALFPGVSAGAVRAAIEMHEAVRDLNDERDDDTPALRIGVGVHVGDLILGTVGETERLDASVIADAVNTASRLEGLTKSLGVDVIVSQAVFDGLDPQDCPDSRSLGTFKIRGRRQQLALREVVAAMPEPRRSQRMGTAERFEEGLELAEDGRWHEAMERFASVLAADPLDTAADHHLDRARKGILD